MSSCSCSKGALETSDKGYSVIRNSLDSLDPALEAPTWSQKFNRRNFRSSLEKLKIASRSPFVYHFLLALVYSLAFFALTQQHIGNHHGILYTPANVVSSDIYLKRFNVTEGLLTPWNGPPDDPTVDEAWEELTKNFEIAVTKDELEKIGYNSLPIPDSRGLYLASIQAIHELHCLKRYRQYFYHKQYFPQADQETWDEIEGHFNHCLEVLRQATICRADPGIWTFHWLVDKETSMPDFTQEHECRDFGALQEWMTPRRADSGFLATSKNPLYYGTNGEADWRGDTQKGKQREQERETKGMEVVTDFDELGNIQVIGLAGGQLDAIVPLGVDSIKQNPSWVPRLKEQFHW